MITSFAAMAQNDSYTQWVANGMPEMDSNQVPPTQPFGGLTTFGDLASFQAATPGAILSYEDFEGGIAPAPVSTCNEPVNSNSNDVCFTPGDLVAGFDITSSLGGGVVVLDPSLLGTPSIVIGANTFSESTVVTFTTPGVDAVAMEVTAGFGGGNVTLTVNGSSGVLGVVSVPGSGVGSMNFIGMVAPEAITSIVIDADGGDGDVMDNLYFGAAVPPVPPVIPTLSTAGLILLGLAVFFFVRKKVQA